MRVAWIVLGLLAVTAARSMKVTIIRQVQFYDMIFWYDLYLKANIECVLSNTKDKE